VWREALAPLRPDPDASTSSRRSGAPGDPASSIIRTWPPCRPAAPGERLPRLQGGGELTCDELRQRGRVSRPGRSSCARRSRRLAALHRRRRPGPDLSPRTWGCAAFRRDERRIIWTRHRAPGLEPRAADTAPLPSRRGVHGAGAGGGRGADQRTDSVPSRAPLQLVSAAFPSRGATSEALLRAHREHARCGCRTSVAGCIRAGGTGSPVCWRGTPRSAESAGEAAMMMRSLAALARGAVETSWRGRKSASHPAGAHSGASRADVPRRRSGARARHAGHVPASPDAFQACRNGRCLCRPRWWPAAAAVVLAGRWPLPVRSAHERAAPQAGAGLQRFGRSTGLGTAPAPACHDALPTRRLRRRAQSQQVAQNRPSPGRKLRSRAEGALEPAARGALTSSRTSWEARAVPQGQARARG